MFYSLLLRDIAEICIYSLCIFAFCAWLKTDRTKNLLLYFFAYCSLTIISWIVQLPTLTPFLCTYAPIVLLLFIVLHEKTLQRNLVSLCAITPARTISSDWLDTVLSSCLAIINNNKSITMVIENEDALDHFLQTSFIINADLNKNVLDILLTSASYDQHKMVWISTSGTIRGINVSWATDNPGDSANTYTMHTDAIVLNAQPLSRTFSIIAKGKETKNIAAHQIHTTIKKQLACTVSSKQKGVYRESSKPEKSLSR